MKIKLCPKCGKQNVENVWNCVDCGTTLSVNTLVDVSNLQSSQVAIAGKGALSDVSPYFQDDLTELIKNNTRSSESIVKGCDICKPSILPPYKFGYLIITSRQLICVCFNSDTKLHSIVGVLPKRPWLKRFLGEFIEGSSVEIPLWELVKHRFVNRPSYALTKTEKESREIISFPISTLYLTEQTNDVFLNLKFRHDDGITLDNLSITFYSNNEIFEIYSLLAAQLIK